MPDEEDKCLTKELNREDADGADREAERKANAAVVGVKKVSMMPILTKMLIVYLKRSSILGRNQDFDHTSKKGKKILRVINFRFLRRMSEVRERVL